MTLVPGPEPLTPMIPPVSLQAVVNSVSCSRSRAPHPNDPSSLQAVVNSDSCCRSRAPHPNDPSSLQAVVNSDSCCRSRAPHPNDPSSRSTSRRPLLLHDPPDVVRHQSRRQPAHHRQPLLHGAIQRQVCAPSPHRQLYGPERSHRRTEAEHRVRVQREGHQRSSREHLESERLQQDIRGW